VSQNSLRQQTAQVDSVLRQSHLISTRLLAAETQLQHMTTLYNDSVALCKQWQSCFDSYSYLNLRNSSPSDGTKNENISTLEKLAYLTNDDEEMEPMYNTPNHLTTHAHSSTAPTTATIATRNHSQTILVSAADPPTAELYPTIHPSTTIPFPMQHYQLPTQNFLHRLQSARKNRNLPPHMPESRPINNHRLRPRTIINDLMAEQITFEDQVNDDGDEDSLALNDAHQQYSHSQPSNGSNLTINNDVIDIDDDDMRYLYGVNTPDF